MAVQPVGRRVSVQWPTRTPGTSVSDPAGGDGAWPWRMPRAQAAPATVEAKARRVSFIGPRQRSLMRKRWVRLRRYRRIGAYGYFTVAVLAYTVARFRHTFV